MAGKGGGGAWKVAYADFVTAMMAFFLVMWITAQSKPVKQAVAEYFEDPLGTNDGSRSTSIRGPEDATTVGQFESGRGPGRSLAMANLKSNKPPNPQGVSAVKPPRMVISRDGDHTRSTGTLVTFASDSVELDARQRERLDLLVPLLLGKPNLVEIRGRVEERFGPVDASLPDGWQFAYGRCISVMRFLTERGVDVDRLRLSQTGAAAPFTVLPEGEAMAQGACVEVFSLSEYARGFDNIHDSRVRKARERPVEESK